MSKYKQSQQTSQATIDTAMTIAKGIQKPGQTKEQTKIIAQGIQKGIAEYKKQQKSKARELDKLKKKIVHQQNSHAVCETSSSEVTSPQTQWLPWSLLGLSWLLMAIFIFISK